MDLSPAITRDEYWADIPGYEGFYEISSQGKIWRVCYRNRFGKVVAGHEVKTRIGRLNTLSKKDSLIVSFYKDGKHTIKLVRQLVADAFLDNPNGYKHVAHRNGDINDCRVENLCWKVELLEERGER